jgi:nicotinamide-nucleotide amidase
LGPTEDDITAAVVAQVFGVPLVTDEESAEKIRSFARSRGLTLLDSLLKQAKVPQGAVVVPNPVGTAPGFIFARDSKTAIALPGVPAEMTAMVEQTVLPYLAAQAEKQRGSSVILSRTLRLAGIGESQAEAAIADLIAAQSNPTIAPYAKTFEVHLRLTAKASDRKTAKALIAPVEQQIRERLGDYIYGADEQLLEAVIGELLHRQQRTLALAESCTGGLIGHRITNIAGSSDYFVLAVTTYSNESKVRLLGVPAEILVTEGAVSPETAAAMAEGVRKASGADIGLSITGIAGPTGATPEKPVGLVFIGYTDKFGTETEELRLRGTRTMIKERAAQYALFHLYRKLKAREVGA